MENFMKRNKIGKNELAANFKENIPMFVMFAPFLIFFVLFTVLPIFSSLALSFTSYDLIASPVFNGIDNYKRLIVNDMTFAVTVKNTLVFAIVAGPLGFLLSFILAWAVNEFSPGACVYVAYVLCAVACRKCLLYLAGRLQRGQLRLYKQYAFITRNNNRAGNLA